MAASWGKPIFGQRVFFKPNEFSRKKRVGSANQTFIFPVQPPSMGVVKGLSPVLWKRHAEVLRRMGRGNPSFLFDYKWMTAHRKERCVTHRWMWGSQAGAHHPQMFPKNINIIKNLTINLSTPISMYWPWISMISLFQTPKTYRPPRSGCRQWWWVTNWTHYRSPDSKKWSSYSDPWWYRQSNDN